MEDIEKKLNVQYIKLKGSELYENIAKECQFKEDKSSFP